MPNSNISLVEDQSIYTFQAASFIMVQFILGILFFILFCYAGLNFYRMIAQKETLLETKKKNIFSSFYTFFVSITALISSFFAFYYAIVSVINYKYLRNQTEQATDSSDGPTINQIESKLMIIFNNGVYIPDVLMFLIYLIVFNQWIIYNRFAHLSKGEIQLDTGFFVIKTYEVPYEVKAFFLIYILGQMIIILLFNCSIIHDKAINFIDMIFNSIQPVLFVTYIIYKSRVYQGCPVKTPKDERYINRIQLVLLYLTIGRCCQILINIFLIFNSVKQNFNEQFFQDISYSYLTSTSSNISTYVIIIAFILIEIFFWLGPLIYSTSNQFLKILSLHFSEEMKMITLDQKTSTNNSQDNEQQLDVIDVPKQKRLFSITDHKDKTIIEFKVEEIILGNQIKADKVQLGNLYHCKIDCSKYTGKEFVCRQVEVKRISQYLIEEINQSVQEYRKLSNRFIQPIKGMAINKDNIYFITPYYQNGNLAEYIYGKKQLNQVTDEMKCKYLLQIATGMNYLHEQKLFHCNLSACNIMIHNNGEIKIIDFGLPALKKYQSLTCGYTTKSQYSSPEQLKERSATPTGTGPSDVYAFGMLAWEIFHSKEAFGNLPVPDLIKLISDEAKRPKINENIPENIKLIIRACWQADHLLRPSFKQIIESLQDDQIFILSSQKK